MHGRYTRGYRRGHAIHEELLCTMPGRPCDFGHWEKGIDRLQSANCRIDSAMQLLSPPCKLRSQSLLEPCEALFHESKNTTGPPICRRSICSSVAPRDGFDFGSKPKTAGKIPGAPPIQFQQLRLVERRRTACSSQRACPEFGGRNCNKSGGRGEGAGRIDPDIEREGNRGGGAEQRAFRLRPYSRAGARCSRARDRV